jgi:hypothetical protein
VINAEYRVHEVKWDAFPNSTDVLNFSTSVDKELLEIKTEAGNIAQRAKV